MSASRTWRSLTAVLLCAAATSAQTEEAILRPVFDRLDADRSKSLTVAEFPGSDAQFKTMDRDRDKQVTFEEYKISAVARRYLAARNRDAGAPRPRANEDATRLAKLDLLRRFDSNRDGRVTRSEWNGAPGAFTDLDLDQNDVLDPKDRKLAERRLETEKRGTYDEFEFKTYLQDSELIYRRYDKNKDQLLERAEIAGAKFAMLFDLADSNGDDKLDMDEIQRMQREVAARIRQRNQRYIRPRAFIVPFSTWDKNKDQRLDTGEWASNQYFFPRIDINRDGAVTKEEVARYKISVEGENFIEKFDLNKDGKVTSAEFAGGRDAFRRADRNGDGVVSGADK